MPAVDRARLASLGEKAKRKSRDRFRVVVYRDERIGLAISAKIAFHTAPNMGHRKHADVCQRPPHNFRSSGCLSHGRGKNDKFKVGLLSTCPPAEINMAVVFCQRGFNGVRPIDTSVATAGRGECAERLSTRTHQTLLSAHL